MNHLSCITLLFMASCLWCTEIDTPVGQYKVTGPWIDVATIGAKAADSNTNIVIKPNQTPVVLMTEGKRTLMLEGGMVDKVNIADGKTFHDYLKSKMPNLSDLALFDWDFYCKKKFNDGSLKFDLLIKLKSKTDETNGIKIDVASARYIEIGDKYLIILAMGKFQDSLSDPKANINWQGFPDRNPGFRPLFFQPVE